VSACRLGEDLVRETLTLFLQSNKLALAMPVGNKDGTERRYNLRATPSRSGRVDDGDQEAGAARFPANTLQIVPH